MKTSKVTQNKNRLTERFSSLGNYAAGLFGKSSEIRKRRLRRKLRRKLSEHLLQDLGFDKRGYPLKQILPGQISPTLPRAGRPRCCEN